MKAQEEKIVKRIWALLSLPAAVGTVLLLAMGIWEFATVSQEGASFTGMLFVIGMMLGAMTGIPVAIVAIVTLCLKAKQLRPAKRMTPAVLLVVLGILVPPTLLLPAVLTGTSLGEKVWAGGIDWDGWVSACKNLVVTQLGTNTFAWIDLHETPGAIPEPFAHRALSAAVTPHAAAVVLSRGATADPEIIMVFFDPDSIAARRFAGLYVPAAKSVPIYRIAGEDWDAERLLKDVIEMQDISPVPVRR